MDKYTEDKLIEIIKLLKQHQPDFHKNEPSQYLGRINSELPDLSKEAARESCQIFEEMEGYLDKPFKYFLAILKNKAQEEKEALQREIKRKGSISTQDIVY